MKKLLLLLTGLFAFIALEAQWVNNPASNTVIANATDDAGEVYTATNPVSGDIYVQWTDGATNGWSPTLQRLNSEGVPQWGSTGIHPSHYTLPGWSQGLDMATTTDGGVVTCFSTEGDHSVAVKINADGTYAWGEQGLMLFNGDGGSRTELLAGDDGGVWALASDLVNLYLCYIEADGTMNPTITISDNGGKMCMFGLMVPAPNGNVFVVYEKEQWAYSYFYEKDVRVVGYSKAGAQISDDIQLMAPQTIGGSYTHYVVPDGMGGGYVYIWHPAGLGGTFNTYVFHFDQYGASTISNPNGASVHSNDPDNFYIGAYATVDPVSHDLIIAYEQTDAAYQAESRIYVNRFNNIGERLWNEGILIAEYLGTNYSNILIDAFDYGGGYSVIFNEGDGYYSTIKAVGINDEGNQIWNTVMSSTSYPRTMCKNSTGFHEGQNVVAWVSSADGNIYAQNIGAKGEMGEIEPPVPPTPCYPPTNFQGEYYFSEVMMGIMVSWDAPETTPLYYNLYCNGMKDVIVIDPQYNSYFQELEAGDYIFKLTAVYEDCESDFALTESGDNYLLITVTSTPENIDKEIVTVTKVYTLNGQMIRNTNLEELSRGVYIIQGLTKDGKLINKKTFINK